MVVSNYTPGVIVPRNSPYQRNYDLIANVMAHKQTSHDLAHAGLQKLRKDALNIRFLNKGNQAKIDAFNQKITTTFNNVKDFGDLSNNNLTARYVDMFNEIAKDTELISAYKKDQKIQKDLIAVEEKKNSKDPIKAGFHPINYANYLNRLDKYINADLSKEEVEVKPYSNYIDVNKLVRDGIKTIPIKKFSRDVVMPNGYIKRHTYTGRDPAAVQSMVSGIMENGAAAQIREQAEYYYNNSVNDQADLERLHQAHTNTIQAGINSIQSKLDEEKAGMANLKGQELVAAANRVADLESRMANYRGQLSTFNDFVNRNDDEIINDVYSMELSSNIKNYTNTYGSYAESIEIKSDPTRLRVMEFNQRVKEFEINTGFKQQKLALDIAKAQSDGTGSTMTEATAMETIGTNNPSQIDVVTTMDTINKGFANMQAMEYNPFQTTPDGKIQIDANFAQLPEVLWNTGEMPSGYGLNPHVKAYQYLLERARRNGMDKGAAQRYAHANVERIFKAPENAREVSMFNELQDIKANKGSLGNLLKKANESGNPKKFLENSKFNMAFQYRRMQVDPDLWKANKKERSAAEMIRNTISSEITNVIGVNAPDNVGEFEDMNYINRLPTEYIKEVEIHPNGNVDVYFKDEAFAEPQGDVGDSDYKPGGPLHNSYYAFPQDGVYTHSSITPNAPMRVNVPSRSVLNWHKNLGIFVDNMPQTRYVPVSGGSPVEFQIVRDIDNSILYRIPGVTDNEASADRDGWVNSGTNNPEAVITSIRKLVK